MFCNTAHLSECEIIGLTGLGGCDKKCPGYGKEHCRYDEIEPIYEQVYEDFWKPIIEKDGSVDLEQIKKELYDYYVFMEEVAKVYDYISGGQVSKPNTASSILIAFHDEAINRAISESLADAGDSCET
jgi:hypothetical protein